MKRLTVLYDAACPLCVRCREWMSSQASFVELEFLPAQSLTAIQRYGEVPWLGSELVVVSDHGEVWVGPAAFIVALWALEDYREWSYRLSGDSFSKMAERFFLALSHRRRWIAGWLSHPECTSDRCHRIGPAAVVNPYR
jgi:predicted DCC family thiol-disulfide oxidoreductase YuxK